MSASWKRAAVGKSHFAAGQIGHHSRQLDPRDVARPLRRAPQHGFDPRQEFLDAERLDDVVVGTQAKPRDPILLVAASGEDDHCLRGARLPYGAQQVEAVAAGEHEVQQQQVVRPRKRQLTAHIAASRLEDSIAGMPQGVDDAAANGGIVFDDENGLG